MEKIKIYIVDNSDSYCNELTQFLNDKYDILGSTNSGKKAYEFVCNNKIDLLIMDIVISEMDGFELLSKINKLENKPKIIINSALTHDGFVSKAITEGAKYFMIKPVDKNVLNDRIQEMFTPNVLPVNSTKNKILEEKISNIFITVGIPAHIKGYQYLREAIKLSIENPDIINSITKKLYPAIANKFQTSASKVERAIRHAIEVAWNRGKIENINSVFQIKVYDPNEKPTNGEFIALVADKMLLEG